MKILYDRVEIRQREFEISDDAASQPACLPMISRKVTDLRS